MGEQVSNEDKEWMDIARTLAKKSKCVSRQVGCILVRNNSIVSSGVNGSGPGQKNCCDHFRNYTPATQREVHHQWSLVNERHAEVNLLGKVIQNQTEISGSTLYVTLQPCVSCTNLIAVSGITRVVFGELYDKGDIQSVGNLRSSNVEVDMVKTDLVQSLIDIADSIDVTETYSPAERDRVTVCSHFISVRVRGSTTRIVINFEDPNALFVLPPKVRYERFRGRDDWAKYKRRVLPGYGWGEVRLSDEDMKSVVDYSSFLGLIDKL